MWPQLESFFQMASSSFRRYRFSKQLCPSVDWSHLHIYTLYKFKPDEIRNSLLLHEKELLFTFQCPPLLSCFRWMGAVALAFRFPSHESLFDAEGLAGAFGGRFRSAAGRTDQHKRQKKHIDKCQHSVWHRNTYEPRGEMWKPAYLIKLYSLIFRLIKSWLVTAAFCNIIEMQLWKSEQSRPW